MPHSRLRRPTLARLGADPGRMASAYRGARPSEPLPAWLSPLSKADRAEFRESGRRLLEMVLEHLDAEKGGATAGNLADAERAAAEYARHAAGLGASLAETIAVFLRYRSTFIGQLASIARRRRLDTREATALLQDAEAVMDQLLIALVNGHTPPA